LDAIEGILDGFDAAQAARGERLACAQRARALASRLTAVAGLLLAKADATGAQHRAGCGQGPPAGAGRPAGSAGVA
jgi:hypothetical protein